MEKMEKPRLKYSPEHFAARAESLSALIERFIMDRSQPGGRPIGDSQRYTLRRIQREDVAGKRIADMKAKDFIDHGRIRKAAGVQPQTILKDLVCIVGALKYGVEILELPEADTALAAYRKAIPQLQREQLIGKGQPRDRRPTQEELDLILAEFAQPPAKLHAGWIPMVPIVKFSYLTGRRISETCRLRWGDVNHEERTCIVRDLKNPKGKGFHAEFPLLGEAWDIVMAQPRRSNIPDERIFPYRAASCSAKYTRAKKKLAKQYPGRFENLHLHDNRRECFSRMFEEGFNVPEVAGMSLHRNPTQLLGTYTRLKAKDLHRGPAAKRERAEIDKFLNKDYMKQPVADEQRS
jgi:integrase